MQERPGWLRSIWRLCTECRAFAAQWAAARQALEARPVAIPESDSDSAGLNDYVMARRLRHHAQTALALVCSGAWSAIVHLGCHGLVGA